ncbi:MAG: elongation factor EF-2 [Candidatus Diapherotrites archaeon]|uniref:Elongation factor 2 n=1 Tax=Candidatus Iainarchaeum sp. TaxID=3101447 RepID=A0A8T3YJ55_9ARCH|nr:elongation factor EF-2 [Candidatus Diapherotrites archaeon]
MAKKEDIVKLAEKLMNRRENIRNMGIVAHIDHGKCVAPSTRLQLADGSFVTAKELFERASLTGTKAKENESEIVYALSSPVNVFSVDRETGRLVAKEISHAWKLKGGKVLEVRTRNGAKVTTTPEHKYLVFDGNEFSYTEAKDLTIGKRIVTVRKAETVSDSDIGFEALKLLAQKGFYAKVNESARKAILAKTGKKEIPEICRKIRTPLTQQSFYFGVCKGRYRLDDLLMLAETVGCRKEDVLEWVEGIAVKGSCYIKWKPKFSDIFYAAGLMVGDGSDNKLVAGKKLLGDEFRRICKDHGIKTYDRYYPQWGQTREIGASKSFKLLLNALFDYPMKNKAHNVKISAFLQKSPAELGAQFLKGYFDTDGCVEKGRNAITITSVSDQMISELPLFLSRFGCVAIVEKDNTISISGESVKEFMEKIGFLLPEKMEKAREMARKSTGSTVCDLVPMSGLKIAREQLGISKNEVSKHYYKYENEFYVPTKSTYQNLLQKMRQKGITNKIDVSQLCFMEVASIKEGFEETVYDFSVPGTRNFVAETIVVHNSTLADSLIAASGLMSEELAGQQRVMDYEDQEQERGITINAANISLLHTQGGQEYLINLIDTPGHVDFGGEVIRAMRAVDGVILVVDAVEGVMPQTETVVRQALREYVRPVLFINKVDRLINELQLNEQQMQERFLKVISQVNGLISKNVPKGFEDEWSVKVQNGSVTFGSAYNKWAISVPRMATTGISFKQVYECLKSDNQKELAKMSKLSEAILEMVVTHLPNPLKAQKYRMPVIWKGEAESAIGKAMTACDEKGQFAMMVTDVSVDKHSGDIATGRVYSGTISKGVKVNLIGSQKEVMTQKIGLFMGPDFVEAGTVPAGNIVALVGLKDVYAGETISDGEIPPFESFMTEVEPVMTVSIEAKSTKDLPKLIEVIRQLTKEDPNLRATINQETGEHLLSGMGELHLEINQYRIEKHHNVAITVSTPIVVYHETINRESPTLESKSPNKHNKLKMYAEPIPHETLDKLIKSHFEGKVKPKDKEKIAMFQEMGFDIDTSKKIWAVHNQCVLADGTKGIEALHEIRELVIQGFNDAMDAGPLAKEKCFGTMIVLKDATLHEDAIHRGPAQMLPTVTKGCYACMLSADPVFYEPKQTLTITVPEAYLGAVSKELGARRTQITEMRQEGDSSIIIGKAPVKELIGFSSSIRGSTQGRALWTAEYAGYEMLPRELQNPTIRSVRKRKGMDEEVKPASHFLE